MKKIFATALLFALGLQFTLAQVERKEIDIEAYGEHVQVLNVGKEGLVFFYPLEKESKKDKDVKWRLQCYDKDLEESWNQEFDVSSKFELWEFKQVGNELYLLLGYRSEFKVYTISLIDGQIVNKTSTSDEMVSRSVRDFDMVLYYMHKRKTTLFLSLLILTQVEHER